MRCDSVHITLERPPGEVFAYLADIENLPRWAVPFCQKLERREGRFFVTSPQGELAFELGSDAGTGAIDLRFGPSHRRLLCYPLRVVALPGPRSLVVFTGWQLPGMSDDDFTAQIEAMRGELQQLREAVEGTS